MQCLAFSFSSTFAPIAPHLSTCEPLRQSHCSRHVSFAQKPIISCKLKPVPNHARGKPSLFAALLAAATLSFRAPVRAETVFRSHSTVTANAIYDSPDSIPHGERHEDLHSIPEGALLRVLPVPHVDNSPLPTEEVVPHKQRPTSKSASYPRRSASMSEWASPTLQRTLSSSRATRISRLRPTTLGLVGVSAFTSGSVFLRSMRKAQYKEGDDLDNARDVCSVVSLQIPFCVSEREQLLKGLEKLATTAKIDNPEGMADASREAAAMILKEEGLLEDSQNFAPNIVVSLAENLDSAEKRFSGHVSIEAARMERFRSVVQETKEDSRSVYGVVTVVVATTEGVDLACYDKSNTGVCNMRCALERIEQLSAGQAAGLELIWIPETPGSSGLDRDQFSQLFPSLKVM